MAVIVERIRRIPKGTVQTYGEIDPAAPRLVGRVLATTHQELPWHRVVRADGSMTQGRASASCSSKRAWRCGATGST